MGAKAAEQQAANAQQPAATPQQQPAQPETPATTAAPVDDTVEQLMKLAQLHDTGALSDEEFAAAKAKIVG
jgi:hypothetical protein